MAKFAVYYVPPTEDELYRLGASVLGYDVRKGEIVRTILVDPKVSPGFPEAWIGKANDPQVTRHFAKVQLQVTDRREPSS